MSVALVQEKADDDVALRLVELHLEHAARVEPGEIDPVVLLKPGRGGEARAVLGPRLLEDVGFIVDPEGERAEPDEPHEEERSGGLVHAPPVSM